MTKRSSGEILRQRGETLREQEKYPEALEVLNKAIIVCQKTSDYTTLVDVLKDITLTWKHLFLLKKDKVYALLAQKNAETMLAISTEFGLKDKLSTSYFRLGEIAMLVEDYKEAVDYHQKALDVFTGKLSERGDFRYHLGEALYRNGKKKEGKETILKGLDEIKGEEKEWDPFYIHVWESGAHMRLAELLRNDEPEESKKHLEEAKMIAESDPRLVIRRRQIEELSKNLNF